MSRSTMVVRKRRAGSVFGACAASFTLTLALIASGCKSAPPVVIPAKPAGPSFEQKMGWILRLEDQRVLHDPAPVIAPAPPVAVRGQQAPVVAPPPPPPDLIRLLSDDEGRIRRRAALAIGHVGLAEGVQPLVGLLADADPEVRQMAAFALGLLGDKRARDPLVTALGDASPGVQGSAAEALGLIGDPSAADAIGRVAAQIVQSGALAQTPADEEEDARRDTPAAACRLSLVALARLKAYPQLAAAVLDANGQPRVRWWPVAFALQRVEDKRALPALLTLAKDQNPYARAFAVKGLAALKDRSALAVLNPLLSSGTRAVLIETVRALGAIGDPSSAEPLMRIIRDEAANPQVRLETVSAIGGVRTPEVADMLLDVLADPSPPIRAAALRSLATFDSENFVTVLSGLDPDPHWSVRAALATVLGTMAPEAGLPRLQALLDDTDQRVVPFAIAALVKLKSPSAATVLIDRLKADDFAVRAAAATGVGELMLPNGAAALAEAYRLGQRDSSYTARAENGAPRGVHRLASGEPDGLDARVPRDRPRVDSDRARGARRAAHRRELRHARAQGLFQRPQRAPRRTRFRDAGRRSPRRRRRRARLFDPRRVQPAALRARDGGHGARSLAGHRRQPVLHHALSAASPRRAVHRLRPHHRRHGCRGSDSTMGCDPPRQDLGRPDDEYDRGQGLGIRDCGIRGNSGFGMSRLRRE